MICVFCGRGRPEIQHLVVSGTLAICDDCISRCAKLCNDAGIPCAAPPRTPAGQVVDLDWGDVALDIQEVVVSWLAEDAVDLDRTIPVALSRELFAHFRRLGMRRYSILLALVELGYADMARVVRSRAELPDQPGWNSLSEAERQPVLALLFRRIPPLLGEAGVAADHGLDIHGERMLDVIAAIRAAAARLGWGPSLALAD